MPDENKSPPVFDDESKGHLTDAFAKLICEILVTACMNNLDPSDIHDAGWEQFMEYGDALAADELTGT